jgi:hypothetical protein
MWEQFTDTKYKMLNQTSHDKAPWYIIRSSDKHKARLETMKLILSKIDYEGRSRALDYAADPKIVFTAEQELEIMDRQLRSKKTS